jgi:hypothetical protein
MPSFVVPDTVQVDLIWQLDGVDFAANVLHFLVGPSFEVDQSAADDIADAVGAAFDAGGTSWKDITNTGMGLKRVLVRDLREASQPQFVGDVSLLGNNASDPLPLQTSLCVTLRTGLAGRKFRGRVYLPPPTEGQSDTNGNPSAGTATAAATFIDAMVDLANPSGDMALAVTSRVSSESTPVTEVVVRDLVWDTQRRRQIPGI